MTFMIRKTDSQQEAASFLALFEPNDEDPRHPVAVVAENEWELWLAEAEDGGLAGGALMRVQPDRDGNPRGFDENLLVDAGYRRQGLAGQLMDAVEDRYRAWGVTGMQAGAAEDDPAAFGFFDGRGYRVVEHYTRRRPDAEGYIVESARVRMWKDF
jgi:ribosomal protein S18 acetylase RimI-like enzyme